MIALFELHALCIVSVCLHKTIHFTVFFAQNELPGPSGASSHVGSSSQVQPNPAVGGEMVATSTESTYMHWW